MLLAESRTAPRFEKAGCPFTLLIFLGFALLVWLSTRTPGARIDLFENGHWLGPASDMLAGRVPYRETFPVHGFLADGGMDYLLFRIFGARFSVSVNAHQALSAFFQPALFLLAAAVTRKPSLAALAIPLNLGFSPGLVFDRPVAALLGLAAFAWALGDARRAGRAFCAGFVSAVGVLYALEFGAFVLAAEVATLALCRLAARKGRPMPIRVFPFLLGSGCVLLPFVAFLATQGALGPFLRTSFIDLPREIGRVWGVRFPWPQELVEAWLKGQKRSVPQVGITEIGPGLAKRLYLCPLLGLLGLLVSLRLLRHRGWELIAFRLFAVSLSCAFFFRYVTARFHIEGGNALTGPLFFSLLLVAQTKLSRGEHQRRQILGTSVAILAAAVVALAMNGPARTTELLEGVVRNPERMRARAGLVRLTVPRGGGVSVPEAEARYLTAIVQFCQIRVPPGAKVLDLANQPGLYFFLERTNPTRFYQVPLMEPFQEEVLRDIKRNPPALVFLDTESWYDRIDGRPNSSRIPRVWSYIRKKYPIRVRVDRMEIGLPAEREP